MKIHGSSIYVVIDKAYMEIEMHLLPVADICWDVGNLITSEISDGSMTFQRKVAATRTRTPQSMMSR
jgi:hypothetical protein